MFCERPADMLDGIYVCHECQTVCFSKDIEPEEKRHLVSTYLNDIQSKVTSQRDYLYDIENKRFQGNELTAAEAEIVENMLEFQMLRKELNEHIKNDSPLYDKHSRKLLYKLLILSNWLSKYFEKVT